MPRPPSEPRFHLFRAGTSCRKAAKSCGGALFGQREQACQFCSLCIWDVKDWSRCDGERGGP
jgi:hypothetical protein